jgi:Cu(I)/Ag(I) efflux system membrane fusion protein
MKSPNILRSIIGAIKKPLVILLPITLFFAGWWFGLPSKSSSNEEEATSETAQLWTCSMHPQIRQPNSGPCPICSMDLIPLENKNSGGGLREITVSDESAALLDLRVSPVLQAPALANVQMFGNIDYDERKIVTTTARMGGRLDRLYADFTGTMVSKGDAIGEIYSPDLILAQHTLIHARKDWIKATSDTERKRLLRALETAREKMRLLNLSEDQIAAIEILDKPNNHITIIAPQTGVVVNLNVKEGQYLKTGDALFGIADLTSVWLKMEAYESDLPWIRYAQKVTFTVEAIPGKTFHGRIAFIDPQLDPQRRIVKVRVNVDNHKRFLKPGMFARATVKAEVTMNGRVLDADLAGKWISPMHPEIVKDGPGPCEICGMPLIPAEEFGFVAPAGPVENPLLIPASAVLRTGQRAIVYVHLLVQNEPVFEGREIVLGSRVGNFFIVLGGLDKGELVVTNGAFKLDSELQIQAQPSMMNQNAGLEEHSTKPAHPQLSGQWPSVLRPYGKLEQSLELGDAAKSDLNLTSMQTALRQIKFDQLQSEERALWKEFLMRLDNTLTMAKSMPANKSSLALIRKQMDETRRFLGLSSTPIAPIEIDAQWITPLGSTIDAYLALAQALASDHEADSLKFIPLLVSEAQKLPSDDGTDQLLKSIKHLGMQKELKGIRTAFKPVSSDLLILARKHGLDNLGNLYVVHCPMADEGKGADWLSEKPEVKNPYYGSAMLGCGDVTDTLSKKK